VVNKLYNAKFHIDTLSSSSYSNLKDQESANFKALRKFYNLQLHA